jgi:hypothetical protein
MYVLHIERRRDKQKYRFKLAIDVPSRKKAIEEFNRYADMHDGESILISCRLEREDVDPDNPDQ